MQEHEINNNLSNGTEKQNHQNNDICMKLNFCLRRIVEVAYNLENCILLKNIPTPYEEFEIYNICEPFGDVKGLYLLKVRGEFQGEAVVEYVFIPLSILLGTLRPPIIRWQWKD